jgi:hypothetical protein
MWLRSHRQPIRYLSRMRDNGMKCSAHKFYAVALLALVGMFFLSVFSGSVAMLLQIGAIGGGVFWVICVMTAILSRRPFGVVDAVRVGGWILIGFSAGVLNMAHSYYGYFYPQYAGLARGCACAGLLAGAFTIVLASIYIPAPRPLQPTGCSHCGYDLTGNISGVCPECGTRK